MLQNTTSKEVAPQFDVVTDPPLASTSLDHSFPKLVASTSETFQFNMVFVSALGMQHQTMRYVTLGH